MQKKMLLKSFYITAVAAIVVLFLASFDHSIHAWILEVINLAVAIGASTLLFIIATSYDKKK
jgi:hypothetical protein